MTLYLKNTSDKKTISLRYGNGNNKLLQINPQENKELPLEINKQKLQVYLHLFKDLKLVDSNKEKKKTEPNDKISVNNMFINYNEAGKPIGQENNSDDSSANTEENAGGSIEGDAIGDQNNDTEKSDIELENGEVDDAESGEDKLNNDESEESENDEVVGFDGEGEPNTQSPEDAENGDGESEQVDNDPIQIYTEKELNSLKAGEVKEIATKLGIEVTSDSTKKALIPVILNKQGN